MTRRWLLELLAARPDLVYARSRYSFRFSVCNETFQGARFEDQCRIAHEIGYRGIEIMPGTLAEDPASIAPARCAELRRIISDHGLEFVGLHNLLTVPSGLLATSSDSSVRHRTWDFVRSLADLCADLGPNGILVFGSGKQRQAPQGVSMSDALARFRDGLASVAPHARERAVTILIEPLAPHLCNLVNRLQEAAALVREIDSPAVRTMFDVHNTAGETVSAPELIDHYIPIIRHVHLNEMDGRRPGTGSYDYSSLFRALERHRYQGWLSLEVFDFRPSGQMVATEGLAFLRSIWPQTAGQRSGSLRKQL
jgi:sugar phosphate isomerase/epimerase